ncbi:MAG: hypothetical protein LBV07_04325, partial [Syntrophobacterales bacterium]|nr:hypothetical protein [Syntrophobacterales bacterium]
MTFPEIEESRGIPRFTHKNRFNPLIMAVFVSLGLHAFVTVSLVLFLRNAPAIPHSGTSAQIISVALDTENALAPPMQTRSRDLHLQPGKPDDRQGGQESLSLN